VTRGRNGPRQPGGGRQQAGPRHQQRGKRGTARIGGSPSGKDRSSFRHSEELGSRVFEGQRSAKLLARKPEGRGRPSSEGRRPAPLREEPRVEKPSPAIAEATKVQTLTVTPDESGMRVDRFFEARFPGLSFSHIQRIIRKGEVRVNGKRRRRGSKQARPCAFPHSSSKRRA
jgi:23S rRNA pseudouridine955/2504/2580 synthase